MLLTNAIDLAEWCLQTRLASLYIRLVLALVDVMSLTGLYAQGVKLLTKANTLAKEFGQDDQWPILQFHLGEFAYRIKDFRIAAFAFQAYLTVTRDQFTSVRADTLHYLAIIHAFPRANRFLEIDTVWFIKSCIRIRHYLQERLKLAYALSDLGYELFHKGQVRVGSIWLARALVIGEEQRKQTPDDCRIWGIVLRTTGHYYREIGELARARIFYDRSIQILEQSSDIFELGDSLFSYGRILLDIGELDLGVSVLLRSLELYETHGYTQYILYTWSLLGKAYTLQGLYEAARTAYQTSMNMAENLPADEKMTVLYIAYYGLGRIASRQNHYQVALQYLQRSLEFRELVDHKDGVPYVLYELASVLVKLGKSKAALDIVNRLIAIISESQPIEMKSMREKVQKLKIELEQHLSIIV